MKKTIIILLFAVLTGIGANLAHPVTPLYIRQLNIKPYMFGLFYTVMNLGIFIMSPFWGNLGDLIKRKYIVLIGLAGYGIAQGFFAYFSNEYLILIARFFAGFFYAAIMTSLLAYLQEDTDFKNKRTLISIFLALNVLGGSLGYLIGGQLGNVFEENVKIVIYIQMMFSVGLSLLTVFLDTRVNKEVKEKEKKNVFKQMSQIRFLSKPLILLLIITALINLAQTNFSKYLDLYITDLGFKSSDLGSFVFVTGIVTIVVTLLLVPYILRKLNPIWVMVISTFVGGIFTFLTFSLNQSYILIWLYSLYMVYVAFKAIYDPALVNHLADYKEVSAGMLMGLRQSALSLGAIVGPLIAGFLYGYISVYLFYGLAGILILMALLLMWYKKLSGVKV
ncbi:MAG: MFS transporter [Acholeplasmataceae bacterium]|nr:MFS transporter [Acholeplasmataceae bacterium]